MGGFFSYSTRLHVPNPQRGVARARHNGVAFNVHAAHCARVALELMQTQSLVNVPHSQCPVRCARHNLVSSTLTAPHTSGVAAQSVFQLAC